MRNKRNSAKAWYLPLASPIKLRDGHVIETLAQAAGLMTQRLPKTRQLKPIWQRDPLNNALNVFGNCYGSSPVSHFAESLG
jgi:hypothetical protein